jgi:hypothetical protein
VTPKKPAVAGAPAAPATTDAPAQPKLLDLRDQQWTRAIAQWKHGNPSRLEAKMRSGEPVPDGARPFLADVVAGKAKKIRGRKVVHKPLSELDFFTEYGIREHFKWALVSEQLREDPDPGTPTERALARCAEKFGKSEDQISKIVFPRKAAK